jgi:hypothetical protein
MNDPHGSSARDYYHRIQVTQEGEVADGYERRALLLNLGDMLEAIHCMTRVGMSYASVGDAVRAEDALAGFVILEAVDPDMRPDDFVQRASGALYLWPKTLLEPELNGQALASMVWHDLFASNPQGWRRFVEALRPEVPWFGEGLPALSSGDSTPAPDHSSAASGAHRGWPWRD